MSYGTAEREAPGMKLTDEESGLGVGLDKGNKKSFSVVTKFNNID